jgi:hypothetical protein
MPRNSDPNRLENNDRTNSLISIVIENREITNKNINRKIHLHNRNSNNLPKRHLLLYCALCNWLFYILMLNIRHWNNNKQHPIRTTHLHQPLSHHSQSQHHRKENVYQKPIKHHYIRLDYLHLLQQNWHLHIKHSLN